MSVWEDVAEVGTDPALLRAAVEQHGRRGGAGALLRAARDRATADPGADVSALVRQVVTPVLAVAPETTALAERWARLGVTVALVGDPGYPSRLATGWPDTGGPTLVARRGAPWRDRPAVAIVGARRASGYGLGVAAWLASAVADAGITVVSGGALGIDAAAHGAAEHGGTVVALGAGHGVGYPREHAAPGGLFERVLAGGGTLLSEHLPDIPPVPANVRARNRIVAGLADVVVVVEGGERSGALVTAGYAADLGVPVMAVPGDVREPGSVAPHRLLAEGAAPCVRPLDLLEAVGQASVTSSDDSATATPPSLLPAAVRAELARRWPRPVRLDDLADATATPVGRLMGLITRARVAGELAEGPDGVRLLRAPRP